MKILAISNVFPPGFVGGYELGASDVLHFLARQGHSVHVLTSDYFTDDDGLIDAFPIDRILECPLLHSFARLGEQDFRRSSWINPQNNRKLVTALKRLQPDLVICFNLAGLGPRGIAELLNSLTARTVYYVMDDFMRGASNSEATTHFDRTFGPARLRGGVIFMSQNVRSQFERSFDFSSCSETIVPGWAEDTGVRSVDRRDGITRFVFCGQVAPHKGIDIVLGAVVHLRSLGLTGFTVDIYGSGLVAEVMQEVRNRQLEEYVAFRGVLPKPEMQKRFAEYRALLFPTEEREPFGFVISEAAVAGCIPIMTTGIGGSEWFLDTVDCIKIERSGFWLAEAMVYLMKAGDAEVARLKRAAINTARLHLSASRLLPDVERFCVGVSESGPPIDTRNARGAENALNALNEIWLAKLS